MARIAIPKRTSEAVLAEYSHRCAICASDRPHLHHIDEDPSHNDARNLLPLCPNCHLRDQHNPTHRIEVSKLRLFRAFKDPAILRPQFEPLFARQKFLENVEPGDSPVTDLEAQALELIELVRELEMGEFYAKRLNELIGPPKYSYFGVLGAGLEEQYDRRHQSHNPGYRAKLIANRSEVQALLVELLRYQPWANAA